MFLDNKLNGQQNWYQDISSESVTEATEAKETIIKNQNPHQPWDFRKGTLEAKFILFQSKSWLKGHKTDFKLPVVRPCMTASLPTTP